MPIATYLLPLLALACLHPAVPSGAALVLGILFALALGNPWLSRTRALAPRLLSWSVMGLGAGMDLGVVGRVGLQGMGYTVTGIAATLLLGRLLGKALRTPDDTSLLISVGTAICGGSAIAAVAPAVRAKPQEISVALGTVFVLNALALLAFPAIGHGVGLDEGRFGLWAALAIHDTSSVVGATLQYGPRAVEVGTTVKLARALWIVPLTFAIGAWRARAGATAGGSAPGEATPAKKPWFILGFVAAAAIVTWVPALREPGHAVESLARRVLVMTLFLIGSGLDATTLRSVGLRPFAQGVALWALVAGSTLAAVLVLAGG